MSSHLILIVEENEGTRAFLADQLAADGYEILLAGSGRHALHLLATHRPQLVLADLNGQTLGLLDAVRGGSGPGGEIDPHTPVIVLTARADELTRVRVFDRGGDDVVAKPFSYPELRGRIRVLLRRAHQPRPVSVTRVGALTVDHRTHEVHIGEELVSLAAKEFELLRALSADPTRVHTREELLARSVGVQRRRAHPHARLPRVSPAKQARGREPRKEAGDQRVGRRLPTVRQRGHDVSAPDQVTDLYRELARHRVEEAIDRLGRAPLDRMLAQAAEVLEEAAGALACMTALYAAPGGLVDQRWQQQINELIAAAASLEQLADFGRHCTTGTNHDQSGEK